MGRQIFFYSNMRLFEPSAGITKKVMAQIHAFRQLGYEVYYSAYTEDGMEIRDSQDRSVLVRECGDSSKGLNRYLRRSRLLALATEWLKTGGHTYEMVYARHHFFDRAYVRMLKAANAVSAKVVVEAHSYPVAAMRLDALLPVLIRDKLWSGIAALHISYVAAVLYSGSAWGCPTVTIQNTVDLEEITPKANRVRRSHPKEIHILSVAYECAEHGLDRLVAGIEQYKRSGGEWDFVVHFVGTMMESTKAAVMQSGHPERYMICGKKSGADLDAQYDASDIGVGPLAIHRRKTRLGTGLKVREYVAKGIPYIFAGEDPCIPDGYPYVARVPLDDSPLDMEPVIALYRATRDVDHLREKMIDLSGIPFGWAGQMEKVLNFQPASQNERQK